jgi:hypothetical protein
MITYMVVKAIISYSRGRAAQPIISRPTRIVDHCISPVEVGSDAKDAYFKRVLLDLFTGHALSSEWRKTPSVKSCSHDSPESVIPLEIVALRSKPNDSQQCDQALSLSKRAGRQMLEIAQSSTPLAWVSITYCKTKDSLISVFRGRLVSWQAAKPGSDSIDRIAMISSGGRSKRFTDMVLEGVDIMVRSIDKSWPVVWYYLELRLGHVLHRNHLRRYYIPFLCGSNTVWPAEGLRSVFITNNNWISSSL